MKPGLKYFRNLTIELLQEKWRIAKNSAQETGNWKEEKELRETLHTVREMKKIKQLIAFLTDQEDPEFSTILTQIH